MKRLVIIVAGLAIIAAALALAAWQSGRWSPFGEAPKAKAEASKGAGKKDGKGRPPITVRTASVEVGPMPVVIDVVGTIESEHVVAVRPQVSGLLNEVLVREGDRVRAGQVLFRIDSRQFDASVNQAKAAMARDQANLELARANEKRLRPLLERDFITRAEYDTAVANVAALQAQVEANRALLEQAKVQADYTVIRATIDGRLGALTVRAGNLLTSGAGSTPLVTINRTNPLLASFSVPQELLPAVRKFQGTGELTVQVLREQGSEVLASGRLVFIDNTVNAQTGTIVMKARMPNDRDVLWPGQFVAVRVVLTTEPEAVIMPEAAVQPGQQGPFVYVFQPGEEEGAGRARVQQIRIDRQLGDRVVIAEGLKGGERVITEVPPGLSANSPIRLPGKGDGKGGRKGGKGGDAAKGEAGKGDAAKAEGARGEPSNGDTTRRVPAEGATPKGGDAAPRKGEPPARQP